MANRSSTFEVRQGDTFQENLILEDTATGVALNLGVATIEAVILFSNGTSQSLDVVITNGAAGGFSIAKSSTETASWPEDDHEGYISITEAGAKTSSDNFTISVIKGAVNV